jgi:hypothetical protein
MIPATSMLVTMEPLHMWSHDLTAKGMELNDAHERFMAAVKPQRVATGNVVVK